MGIICRAISLQIRYHNRMATDEIRLDSTRTPEMAVSPPKPAKFHWALTALGIATILGLCYWAELVLAVMMFSVMLAFILAPVVDFLMRWRLPRGVAALISVILLVAIVAALLYYTSDRAADARSWIGHAGLGGSFVRAVPRLFHADLAASCALRHRHAVFAGESAHGVCHSGPDFCHDSQLHGGQFAHRNFYGRGQYHCVWGFELSLLLFRRVHQRIPKPDSLPWRLIGDGAPRICGDRTCRVGRRSWSAGDGGWITSDRAERSLSEISRQSLTT